MLEPECVRRLLPSSEKKLNKIEKLYYVMKEWWALVNTNSSVRSSFVRLLCIFFYFYYAIVIAATVE